MIPRRMIYLKIAGPIIFPGLEVLAQMAKHAIAGPTLGRITTRVMARVTKIIHFCNFLLRIGKTGKTRFGAGITHSNGSAVIHFPKYRQCGVRTAHTLFLRCEQFPMLGALGGCGKNFFCTGDPPPYNCYFVKVVGTRKYCYYFSH